VATEQLRIIIIIIITITGPGGDAWGQGRMMQSHGHTAGKEQGREVRGKGSEYRDHSTRAASRTFIMPTSS